MLPAAQVQENLYPVTRLEAYPQVVTSITYRLQIRSIVLLEISLLAWWGAHPLMGLTVLPGEVLILENSYGLSGFVTYSVRRAVKARSSLMDDTWCAEACFHVGESK